MRILVVFLGLLFSCHFATGQQNYEASLIPKDLLPYASAVIRNKDVSIEVKDFDNTIYHIKEAITVLNKNGDNLAHMAIFYDKSINIKFIKGFVFDEFGKQVRKFSESDFSDESTNDGFSLFQDERVKHYLPAVTTYPYTIAYEYETHEKQSLNFDAWRPNPQTSLAVEKSSFTFACKRDFSIRYLETNMPNKVVIGTNAQGFKTYTWQINNLKAVKYEPYSPYEGDFLCSVKIAPDKFNYYGNNGSFTNWPELGKWYYDKLIANRQALPQQTVDYVRQLTQNITDPKLKARKIYEYMQGKTHYISVQVGIGGYQPFSAEDVDKLNYGDCKALVNYTQALLKAVNIESYYCVVESGRNYNISLLPNFASMAQGNHIILCLPFKNDTTWADCTSQTLPFGYLGDFTDDRIVLACTPNGGKLMHTPKYAATVSLKTRKCNFTVSAVGVLTGNIATTFKGADYDDDDELINEPQKEQYRILKYIYPINNLEIDKLDIRQIKSFDPVTTETIKLNAVDYASTADGKLNFPVNAVSHIKEKPAMVRNRINLVYINRGHTEEDEIVYTIPDGYKLDRKPLNTIMTKPFAKYTATMVLNGNQLVYHRKLEIIDGMYNKEIYQDLVDFYQDVFDDDEYQVVLVKS